MQQDLKKCHYRKNLKKRFFHFGILLCIALVILTACTLLFAICTDFSLDTTLIITFLILIVPFLLYNGVKPLKKDLSKKNFAKSDLINWTLLILFCNQTISIFWLLVLKVLPYLIPYFVTMPPLLTISGPTLNTSPFLTIFFSACFIAPIIEEMIFRSILFNKLKMGGLTFAILSSSLLFSLLHLNLKQLPISIVLGIVLALAKHKHSLRLAIYLHGINNFSAFFIGFIFNLFKFSSITPRIILLCILYPSVSKFYQELKPWIHDLRSTNPLNRQVLKDFFLSPSLLLFFLLSSLIIFFN